MKGIRVCSNKGTGPLQRGDNHKNVNMGLGHLKIFSRTTGPILTSLGTLFILGRNDSKFVQVKGIAPLQGEVIVKIYLNLKKKILLQNQLAKIN
jgi:hypothetical protein